MKMKKLLAVVLSATMVITSAVPVLADTGVEDANAAGITVNTIANIVGNEDNSTAWWTNWSESWAVEKGQSYSVSFVNYGSKVENWNNFSVILQNVATEAGVGTAVGYAEYAAVRADNFGWGTGYTGCALESNWDWATFKDDMDGALVTVTVANKGTTADVLCDITTAAGVKRYQNYKGIFLGEAEVDTIYYRLGVDSSHYVPVEVKASTAPTCTGTGTVTYASKETTPKEYTLELAAKGHSNPTDAADYVVTQNPTCVDDGTCTYTCSVCEQQVEGKVPASGSHTQGENPSLETSKAATCTQDGHNDYVCTVCEESVQDVIPKLGHSYKLVEEVLPTAEEAGHYAYTVCERYGAEDCSEMYADATRTKLITAEDVKIPAGTSAADVEKSKICEYENLSSSTWWTFTGVSKDYILTGAETKYFTVKVDSVADGEGAFNVELVGTFDDPVTYEGGSSNKAYITTGSLGDAWYAEAALSKDVCPNPIEGTIDRTGITEGHTYVIAVSRDEEGTITVTYADETDSKIRNTIVCPGTRLPQNVAIHIMAQTATIVAAPTIPSKLHIHDFDETKDKVEKEPTCTEDGLTKRSCTSCGETIDIIVPATGKHTMTKFVKADPTCTTTGVKKTYYYCNVCKKYYNLPSGGTALTEEAVKERIIPMTAHKYVNVITKATTTKAGSIVSKCSDCGKVAKTTAIPQIKTVALSKTAYTYTGKALKPGVTVKDAAGKTIAASNYTVAYKNNIKAGKATVTVTFKGNYSGTVSKTFTIAKKAQSISKVVTAKTLKATSLKKKASTFKIAGSAKGKLSYKVTKKDAKKVVSVSTKGTVTVKKGAKKGTYKVNVTVTAAETSAYKVAKKNIVVTVKVK